MFSSTALFLVGALSQEAAPYSSTSTDVPQRWAGHQVTYGTRKIPFRGEVTTRTETLVLADASVEDRRLVIREKACAVRFRDVGNVHVRMDASSLPVSRMIFSLQEGGDSFTGGSRVSWRAEDIDRDGNPGMTVNVDAPVCSGDLYVANDSRTVATGAFRSEGFHGFANVRIAQTVLGSRGRCLGLVARDSEEVVSGPFAYVRVAAGATCASLLRNGWPIDAES